jgi:uncharacterized protein YoxC
MTVELFLLLLFIVLVVLAAFIIPLLIRLNRLSQSVDITVKDLDDTVKKLNGVIEALEDSAGHIKNVTQPVGEIGNELTRVWNALRETEGYVSNIKVQVSAFVTAVKTTLDALVSTLFKKKENEEVQ